MTERARGFAPFPPRRGGGFASSWWGKAWIKALEDTSLDQGRLSRGRTYARSGRVQAITVSPGLIRADVAGSRPEPYRVRVNLEPLRDNEWERFYDRVAQHAGHIAALLDRDMPHDLVDTAADAGVPLLPGIGDLDVDCDCPDWGDPCKHAAALCYQAARLLDTDPFVLLLMRGRDKDEVLAEIGRRNVGELEEVDAPVPATVPAAAVFGARLSTLPTDPPLVDGPGRCLVVAPQGFPSDSLDLLVADAAARAGRMLRGAEPPDVDLAADTARWASDHPDTTARLVDLGGDEVRRAAAAWRYGGLAGLEALRRPSTVDRVTMARARVALLDRWPDARVTVWRGRISVAAQRFQLRHGRDGRWYPYRQGEYGWTPSGPPVTDPAAAL